MRKVWNTRVLKWPVAKAFTVVELIIVIVVIGVLAILVFVGYIGLTSRADIASIQSDLTNNAKKLQLYFVRYRTYPTQFDSNVCPSAPTADTTLCLKLSGSNTINNYVGTASSYVLGIAKGSTCYQLTDNTNATNYCSSNGGFTAEQLLAQARLWIDASYSTNGQTISNLGTGGSVLNATAGSSTNADGNDPRYLGFDGTPYVYLPGGTMSNRVQVPDAADLRITGDIDIRQQLALDNWMTGSDQGIFSKMNADSSWRMWIGGSGQIKIEWWDAGTVNHSASSTANVGYSAGAQGWIRAVIDVDNGTSGNTVYFYTSSDGVTWTQLGSPVVQGGVTNLKSTTDPIFIGLSSGNLAPMKLYSAQIYSGINGTKVLDVDTSVITSGSATAFTAKTGQTVNIYRDTAGRKSVAVVAPIWLFGTDDYMEVADNDLLDFTNTDSFTIVGVVREWATPPLTGGVLVKKGSTTIGWGLR